MGSKDLNRDSSGGQGSPDPRARFCLGYQTPTECSLYVRLLNTVIQKRKRNGLRSTGVFCLVGNEDTQIDHFSIIMVKYYNKGLYKVCKEQR